MARLVRKVESSSLIETVEATIIIVVIFTIASLTLTTVMKSVTRASTFEVEARLDFLFYQLDNNEIQLPYEEDYKMSFIELFLDKPDGSHIVILKASDNKGDIILEKERWLE